jgi:hypothetical protein
LYGKDKTVLVGDHECGEGATISLPHGIVESEKGICARDDFFGQPLGRFNFLWTMGFSGHRSVDVDAIYGKVPLHSKVLNRAVGPSFCFPLADWSDEDVWRYIKDNNVPVDERRYDVENEREWQSKEFNSDYLEVCVNCVHKRDRGKMVYCPKVKKEIPSISDKVPLFPKSPDYFDTEFNAEV